MPAATSLYLRCLLGHQRGRRQNKVVCCVFEVLKSSSGLEAVAVPLSQTGRLSRGTQKAPSQLLHLGRQLEGDAVDVVNLDGGIRGVL